MSHALSQEQYEELHDLITALHEKCITEEQSARLEEYICHSEEACRIYVQYTHLYANLRWREMQEPDLSQASSGPRGTTKTPVLGFLGDVFQAGVDFLSRGIVVTLLLTVGLPSIMLLLVMVHASRQPTLPAPASPVAKIVQMHECVWSEGSLSLPVGANLFSGQRVRLNKGLAKVAFADGTSVLLEGPVVFEANTRGKGFLHLGRLVALVPKGAEGFVIATPTATVVDYGTEFGVSVEDKQGTVEVQVFQGEVAVKAGPENTEQDNPIQQRLTAGKAVRVELDSRKNRKEMFVVRHVATHTNRFVRQLPASSQPTEKMIVANFSGGEGNRQVDQYPGKAGSGWASDWYRYETEGVKLATSIEQSRPLNNGGNYLRVLAERESGAEIVYKTIERKMEVAGPVDLRKPYQVSFDVRLDDIGGFTKWSDHLIICNNMCTNEIKRKGPSSGWHIRLHGNDYPGAPRKHWTFVSNDGTIEKKIGSGIPVREGKVYSFQILFEPSKRQWTPSISVDGGPWKKYKPMCVRSLGTAEERGYWPYFYLYWMMDGGNTEKEKERIGFSIDSIKITAAE